MPRTSSSCRPVLLSSEEGFSFKTNFFFYGRPAKLGRKGKHDVLEVKTIGIKETVDCLYVKNKLIVGLML